MSPLTKIFVILLVVCSMLTSAATVVFVNKVDVFDQANRALDSKLKAANRDLSYAQTDAATARGKLVAAMQSHQQEADAQKLTIDKLTADLAAKDVEKNNLVILNSTQEGNLQGVTAQLAIAQEASKKEAEALNALRDVQAKSVQTQAETDAALARQRQLAETYGRQVEYLTEQLKKLTDFNNQLAGVIKGAGLSVPVAGAAAPAGAVIAAPQINGVVRDKQDINGVTYLTISVGSADGVEKGMEFSVVDSKAQPPEFHGILNITQTDTNSAIGRLQADQQMVAKVKQGDEVTTHLQ